MPRVVNDTDALLKPLDNEATALFRKTVSVERAVLMPASTDESPGMAVLLKDAIALTRETVSLDNASLSVETKFNVLALIVKLVLVFNSDAIFSSVLNLAGAPLKMF